ncbi:hypothetical protein ACFYRW_23690 [Rhodococcus pyridinivorans]|uniref:hypothetical protein n=1 Tax=Rhodococcus TaxID=1827 RepID=UPI000903DAEB|nr:hypothetical protein [Rhodococcus sp. 2G]APE09307.1 hypothetical protein BO226_08875 [Rhodococcus sp. 2G]
MRDFDPDLLDQQPGYLAWRSHRFRTRLSREWVDNTGRMPAAGDQAREAAIRIRRLIDKHGHFLFDTHRALEAFREEDTRFNDRVDRSGHSLDQRLRLAITTAHELLPLAFVLPAGTNPILTTLCRRLTDLTDRADRLITSHGRHQDDQQLRSAVDEVHALMNELHALRNYPPEKWTALQANSRRQFAQLYFGGYEMLGHTQPPTPPTTPIGARLTFTVLPEGTSTRRFVSERQAFHRRQSTANTPTFDPRRTDIIDELVAHYGAKRCTIYRGTSDTGHVYDTGDNINEDYLVLVISSKIGDHAVAISPAAGRHATYVVRHDVGNRQWSEVFAHPKIDAKKLGAERLVFREKPPLDQYQSMREKIKALLSCSPRAFHGRLDYVPQRHTYVARS